MRWDKNQTDGVLEVARHVRLRLLVGLGLGDAWIKVGELDRAVPSAVGNKVPGSIDDPAMNSPSSQPTYQPSIPH